jgi:hypothetical protein
MRMNLRAACITIVALAGLAGCGYSAPNNSPTAPDSGTGSDSMAPNQPMYRQQSGPHRLPES